MKKEISMIYEVGEITYGSRKLRIVRVDTEEEYRCYVVNKMGIVLAWAKEEKEAFIKAIDLLFR